MSNKKAYETAAHANDGYVTKDAPLILFRGALDHCQAEIIVTQAMLDQEILFARSIDPAIEASLKRLQNDLQELVDVLRDIMTAEYTGEPLKGIHSDGSGGTFRLFGLTLDELQEHSHNAEEHYGIPTMTRPDHRYGEVYAHLNLIRTELRQVETAAVRLFLQRPRPPGHPLRPEPPLQRGPCPHVPSPLRTPPGHRRRLLHRLSAKPEPQKTTRPLTRTSQRSFLLS